MKKLLILLVAMSTLIACSEDDDSGASGNIVGTWTLAAATNIPGYTVNECTGQSTITFNADNTASSTFYTYSSGAEGDCVSNTDTGEWSNSSGSQYTIEVPGLGDLMGTVTFNSESSFTFVPNDFPASSLTFEK